jgi:transcriptional regulator with XRE-family HTH domain
MEVGLAYIGSAVRRARLAKRLSQLGLARKLGVRQGTISRAESGHDLRVGTLLELARALDLDVVLVPRNLRTTVDNLVAGAKVERTSVYTGRGDEPYYEGEAPDESTPYEGRPNR